MTDADRPEDEGGLSSPERDAMVAALVGVSPDRLRTIRRVQRKRADGAPPSSWATAAHWQRIDELSDDALFATFRRHEVRARAVARTAIASPVERLRHRSALRR
jgi:hypothetical protein